MRKSKPYSQEQAIIELEHAINQLKAQQAPYNLIRFKENALMRLREDHLLLIDRVGNVPLQSTD